MNGHDAFLELASLYSVGALSDLERRRFEAHLAHGCPECEAELSLLRPAIDALAGGVEPVAVRPELRDRVLSYAGMWARPGAERAAPPSTTRAPRRLPMLVVAAASVGIAVAFAAQVFSLRAELEETRARSGDFGRALAAERQTLQQVRAELEQSRATQQLLTAQIATLEATSRVLTAPATRSLSLAGQGPGAAARARAFLSPDTGTVILYVYDLPELPADQTYQAWVIPGQTPVPIGVFTPAPGGMARHEASGVAGLAAPITVAVTIEPQGGLPQPSGPIVLAGK